MTFARFEGLYFTTATILNWYPLFNDSKFAEVFLESLRFSVVKGRTTIYAFVIMPNHIHLIWQMRDLWTITKVRRSIMVYTAKRFEKILTEQNDYKTLARFKTRRSDRSIQFWKVNPYNFEIWGPKVLHQKMRYVHLNPKRAGLAENYPYCSLTSYENNTSKFDFLTRWENDRFERH